MNRVFFPDTTNILIGLPQRHGVKRILWGLRVQGLRVLGFRGLGLRVQSLRFL